MAMGAEATALLYGLTAMCSLSEQALNRWVTQELELGRLSMATHGRIPRGAVLHPSLVNNVVVCFTC